MLQSIKSQVQHQINGIAQDQGAVGVDESGRAIRRYEQCETILTNILDRPEYSGKLSDVELCRRICRSVGVEFDDSLSASPDKCIEMVASAVVDYVDHEVVDDLSRKNVGGDSVDSDYNSSDDDMMQLAIDDTDSGFISSDDEVISAGERREEEWSDISEQGLELQSNKLSIEAKKTGLNNVRCFPVVLGDSCTYIMGAAFPENINSVGFVFDKFGSFYCFQDISKSLGEGLFKKFTDFAKEINPGCFLSQNGEDNEFPKGFYYDPILDYKPPSLQQFVRLSNVVKVSCSMGENVLVFCGYGGGRTGTMLAAVKLLHGFSRLDAESKTALPNMQRNFHVENYNGTFKNLDHSHRTTADVHDVVVELRESEKDLRDGVVSVETPDQFLTLELWRLLLSINHKVKVDKEVSDKQIKKWIVGAGFSYDFLEQFGENDEIGEGGEALCGLDYIVRTFRTRPRTPGLDYIVRTARSLQL